MERVKHYESIVRKRLRVIFLVYALIVAVALVLFLFCAVISVVGLFRMMRYAADYNINLLLTLTLLAVVFGFSLFFIISPVFDFFRKRETISGTEIFENEYPELYGIIREVADRLKVHYPYKILVSNICNLGVKTSLRKKNKNYTLLIGFPALFGVNKTELKVALSHELAHLNQDALHVNSMASLLDVFGSFLYDRLVDDIEETHGIIGWLSSFFKALLHRALVRPLDKLKEANQNLSWALEYDADKISCLQWGTEASVSFLCKLEVVSQRWVDFIDGIRLLGKDEGRCPKDFLTAFSAYSEDRDRGYSKKLLPASHFEYEDSDMFFLPLIIGDDSHPETSSRIEAMKNNSYTPSEWDDTPAFDLFENELIREIIDKTTIDLSRNYLGNRSLVHNLSEEDVRVKLNAYPSYLNCFYSDDLFVRKQISGTLEELSLPQFQDSPFTYDNAKVLMNYLNSHPYNQSLDFEYISPLQKKALDIAHWCNCWMLRKTDEKGLKFEFNCMRLSVLALMYLETPGVDESLRVKEALGALMEERQGMIPFDEIADNVKLSPSVRRCIIRYYKGIDRSENNLKDTYYWLLESCYNYLDIEWRDLIKKVVLSS